MKWTISKDFYFDYSHRVWVQKLREEFCASGDTGTKCRFIHGHTGCVRIWVEGDELNPQSMLCDFKELGFAKDFFDKYIDHKFILDRNDPWFENIINGHIEPSSTIRGTFDEILNIGVEGLSKAYLDVIPVYVFGTKHLAGHCLDVSKLIGPEREFYESFFIVDFVPTSENLARWIYNWAQAKLSQIDVKVSRIEWSETPKSRAVYE